MGEILDSFKKEGFRMIEIFSSCCFSLALNKFPLRFSAIVLELFFLEKEKFIFDFLKRNLVLSQKKIKEMLNNVPLLV